MNTKTPRLKSIFFLFIALLIISCSHQQSTDSDDSTNSSNHLGISAQSADTMLFSNIPNPGNSNISIFSNCQLRCKYPLSDSVKFIEIAHGVEFHYYTYPENYIKESLRLYWDEYMKDWTDYEDSLRWTSPDGYFTMTKSILGFDYNFPQTTYGDIDIDNFDTMKIQSVIDLKFSKAGDEKFIKYSNAIIENSCRNKNTLTIIGRNDSIRILYKIIVANVEGGMYCFVDLFIQYPLSMANKYDAIAVKSINYFSNE